MISRLTDQKGFDLIAAAADELMALDASWVMLGSGEREYEDLVAHAWRRAIRSGCRPRSGSRSGSRTGSKPAPTCS